MSSTNVSTPSSTASRRPFTHAAVFPPAGMPAVIARPSLPANGFLRQPQVLALVPVSSATWWRWVKSGKAPKAYKLSERVTAWRAEDIRQFLDTLAPAAAQ